MTWIVGMALNLGVAVGISDVRVSSPDGAISKDCLQKIYPVGRDIALGFAGSVSIGFRMVSCLTKLLSQCPPDQAWDPTAVAGWWPADARDIFAAASDQARAGQCDLMMLSAHPNESMGDAPWPRTFVHIFRSPTFDAVSLPFNEAESIGSGAVESGCVEALKRLTGDDDAKFGLLQFMAAGHGGPGLVLGHALSEYIREAQPDYISPHLNLCTVTRGQVSMIDNDYVSYEGEEPVHFKMPRLARSIEELIEITATDEAVAARLTC